MESSGPNGGPVRVILYARVSTRGQARDGFSRDQQLERLREYAAEQGYDVLEEIIDPGYSGTVLERPGLDRVRDLVEEGGISVVLAQDADRITRDPIHRGWLDDELAKRGTRLVALDDWGDDSHEGQLLKYIKGWQAKGEARKTAERSRRNKRKKARQGMVIGGPKPAYGFSFVRNEKGKTVGYEVDEAAMQTVRRIFYEVASGKGLRPLKDELDTEHVPTPGNGEAWSRTSLRNTVQNDLYKPHTFAELRASGIADDVLGKLDADEVYGVYRFEGIPVPIPDVGIPLEVVTAARHNVENNRSPSRAGDRFGELSGGILLCSGCGRRMQHYTTKPRDRVYHYYRCLGTTNGKADTCTMRTYVHAGTIEEGVWEAVSRLMDDKEYVLGKMHEHFAQRRKELSRSGADARTLVSRLEGIERRWERWKHAFDIEALSEADLKGHKVKLDAEREQVERELERVRNRDTELVRLAEEEAEIRERIEGGHYDLEDMTPEKRHALYQDFRLRVEVGEDKKPRISGVFPLRIGKGQGWLWKTPETAYIITGEPVSTKDTPYERGGP